MMPLLSFLVAAVLVAGMILLRIVVERSVIRARIRGARNDSECEVEACMHACGMPTPLTHKDTNTQRMPQRITQRN